MTYATSLDNSYRPGRKYPRVDLECELLINAKGQDYWVTSVNLSFGGALIQTDAPLEGGDEVSLTLNHMELYGTTQAKVMWTSATGFGLKFVNPDRDFLNALVGIITPLLPPEETWDQPVAGVPA